MRTFKVVLFGNTLLIEGVQIGLRQSADFEIVRITNDLNRLSDQMQISCPDVVIFDLVATQPAAMLDTLRQCSHARLIGLDPNHNTAVELSSQFHSTLSTNDLTQIILGG